MGCNNLPDSYYSNSGLMGCTTDCISKDYRRQLPQKLGYKTDHSQSYSNRSRNCDDQNAEYVLYSRYSHLHSHMILSHMRHHRNYYCWWNSQILNENLQDCSTSHRTVRKWKHLSSRKRKAPV